jgi:poly-beta-hydroxyalkanoate depolymerase
MIHWTVPAPRLSPGVLDSLFDYQGDDWFGVARFAPVPPPWSAAETDVLGGYLELAFHLAQTRRFDALLGEAIERTLNGIREELARRWA